MDPNFGKGVAIVAGGSGGIGRAICMTLAREANEVFLWKYACDCCSERTAQLAGHF